MRALFKYLLQLAFAGAATLSNKFGHAAGKDAALTVIGGVQVLIGLLLIQGRTPALRTSLTVALVVYHTFLLPAALSEPNGTTAEAVWQGLIGETMVSLNLAVYHYAFDNAGTGTLRITP
jgi:hypothetical protein